MPGRVQRLDHRLELADQAGGAVAVVGREEADRVVAPVVAQAALDQMAVVDEGVHRHQLDRSDAQALEVVDDRRRGQAGVGAAQVRRHVGCFMVKPRTCARRSPCRVPGHAFGALSSPQVKAGSMTRHLGMPARCRGGRRTGPRSVADLVAEHGASCQRTCADDILGVGLEQQLVGLKRWPRAGRRDRAPGSRRAGRGAPRAGSSARPGRSARATRCAALRGARWDRTGTVRRVRRVRKRARS
jgi:hypothetical protein